MTLPQLVKKGLTEFLVRRRESSIIRFLPRHVRGGKHFARSERRIVRFQRTTEAQNAAKLSRKSGNATFSTDTGRALTIPVSVETVKESMLQGNGTEQRGSLRGQGPPQIR